MPVSEKYSMFNKTALQVLVLLMAGSCLLQQWYHCYMHNTKHTWYNIVVTPYVKYDAPMTYVIKNVGLYERIRDK